MANLRYMPINVEKYAGQLTAPLVARSSWEIEYMKALDNSKLVVKWMSEPKRLNIKYIDPITGKLKSYWPDFFVQYANNTLEIIEIKPLKEALAEKAKNTYDKLMLVRNIAKWEAADRFARSIGARFRVVTEQQLYKKPVKRGKK